MIYGGDGLARLSGEEQRDVHIGVGAHGEHRTQQRGKALFVPFTLAGEIVEAVITEEKTGFARAKLERVVSSSPHRIAAGCPHFQRCGGCHYQHTTYEQQLAIKTQILAETVWRQGKVALAAPIRVHAGEPWQYRNRSRFQVRVTPNFVAGFFRLASHDILPIEQCPISSPLRPRVTSSISFAIRNRLT